MVPLEPLALKVTVPVGVPYPVTTAVQVVVAPAASGSGEQLTAVVEDALLTVTDPLWGPVEVLPALLASPLKVPVIV